MPCHIIIVDDDDDIRPILTAAAREAVPSAVVTEYTSSLHALHEVECGAANLLITNYKMPDMNGLELTATIRRQKNAIPIIMVSGSVEAESLAEKVGIDRFVPKHAIRPALGEAIRALIDVTD
ncbi:MAG TPA: response regulator [Chthoniobacter sp.]